MTREERNVYFRDYRKQLKEKLVAGYGGACRCCNQKEVAFLTIDHINNNGAEERRNGHRTSTALYRRLVRNNFPGGYQLLCWNCNAAKQYNGGCPHKIEDWT